MQQLNNHDPAMDALFGEEMERQDKSRKMSERERLEFTAAMRDLLDSEPGRRFVWWLLEQTHVFQGSFTGNSHTFFLEGERNVGLKILALCMEADPAFMAKLVEFKRDKEKQHGG